MADIQSTDISIMHPVGRRRGDRPRDQRLTAISEIGVMARSRRLEQLSHIHREAGQDGRARLLSRPEHPVLPVFAIR